MAQPKKFDSENPVRTVPAEEVRRLLAEVRQADLQVKSGHYTKHEDMKAWLLSWGNRSRTAAPEVRLRVVPNADFFHHNQAVSAVTYTQLARCENDP